MPKKMMKKYRATGQDRRAQALKLVLQGHLHKVAKLCTACPLRGAAMHETHWLWDCSEVNKVLQEPGPQAWEPLCRPVSPTAFGSVDLYHTALHITLATRIWTCMLKESLISLGPLTTYPGCTLEVMLQGTP